jgi:hypothetical protein
MHKCTNQYFIIFHFGEPFFIQDSPTVSIMNMDHLDVVENATLQLACQVLDANPTLNTFSWYKGRSTTPIGLLSNFSISKVIRTDSEEYRCEGSNGIGQNGVDTVYVNVLCRYQSYYNIMCNIFW